MTQTTLLRLRLRSAATFGKGSGLPGVVDQELEQDDHGLPYLRGRTLKGLLVEECEGILFALEEAGKAQGWRDRKKRLFGVSGSGLGGQGILHVGDACLPARLRLLLLNARLFDGSQRQIFTPNRLYEALTAVRRQTAMNGLGGPEEESLRALRVLLPGVLLEAELCFSQAPEDLDWALLAASALALRRAGVARNRGRGWLQAELESPAFTHLHYQRFAQEVRK
jgi:hypothetical protein